jgi:hypothetical protein
MAKSWIAVRGGGVAATCCLQLLEGQGATGNLANAKAARPGAVLISQGTQKLLGDIFGRSRESLFAGFPLIRTRVVAWGRGTQGTRKPLVLPHLAVVASETELLARLRGRLAEITEECGSDHPTWTIVAARPMGGSPEEMEFGSRTASVREVELAEGAAEDACWVESVENGWLFLLATGSGRGSLISVGSESAELLGQSWLVARQVRRIEDVAAEFAAYARILTELCGMGWLACGSAAMTFDPLCGEGAGNSAREAILACAAVRAIFGGESAEEVLAEYSLRLRLGFLRHLEKCREFYVGDWESEFWSSELARVEEGIAWTKARISGMGHSRFRLRDFLLERVPVGRRS